MSSRPQSGYGSQLLRSEDGHSTPGPSVGQPTQDSPLAHSEGVDDVHHESTVGETSAHPYTLGRSTSTSSTKVDPTGGPNRSGTLMKSKGSVKKRASLSRRNSRRSVRAGSMKALGGASDEAEFNNVFHTPIPTIGNPTEVLANRFQAWRKLLKDLIAYFREIQASYDHRAKALLKVSNVINNTSAPTVFVTQGGLDEATNILRGFHKQSLTEANKAKDIEQDVITQLNGLRSDLSQKIKEIKSLSGDFKNSVEKEKEATRRAVTHLQDALAVAESDPASAIGKGDPFIVRLAADRQVDKQIEEENYLHRAYLNLEGSGRELESIVVGEIQKAYNAYAGILKREADQGHEAVDDLRSGPINLSKDYEWDAFVENDKNFINPNIPLRRVEDVHYPGKFSPAAADIRSGMLERKSKYLKSYTPGWYVLSATHIHEFKSADHIQTQSPVMSLCLLDQRLGSHSQPGATSHKFSLKGKQTGGMHRGHSWVFRAESYDTMMAWYEDIKVLTEKSGAEKSAFVRRHARSTSAGSNAAPSVSSDGIDEDEADAVPYSAHTTAGRDQLTKTPPLKRPEPGGRFPSDIDVERRLQAPLSPSSGSSGAEHVKAAVALPSGPATFGSPQSEVYKSSPGKVPTEHTTQSPNSQNAEPESELNVAAGQIYPGPYPHRQSTNNNDDISALATTDVAAGGLLTGGLGLAAFDHKAKAGEKLQRSDEQTHATPLDGTAQEQPNLVTNYGGPALIYAGIADTHEAEIHMSSTATDGLRAAQQNPEAVDPKLAEPAPQAATTEAQLSHGDGSRSDAHVTSDSAIEPIHPAPHEQKSTAQLAAEPIIPLPGAVRHGSVSDLHVPGEWKEFSRTPSNFSKDTLTS